MARRYLTGTPIERVLASIVLRSGPLPTPCWVSTYSTNEKGYARVKVGNSLFLAHRVTYENSHGPIPDDMELDHLCRNRACVAPDHLEAVTHQINMDRAMGATHIAHREGRCLKGHTVTGATCRVCANDRNRRWRASLRN